MTMGAGRRYGTAACICVCVAVLIGGCGTGQRQDHDAATPPVVPGLDTAGPDLTGVNIPAIAVPDVTRSVSRPTPRLTPGVGATRDITTVCAQPEQQTPVPVADRTLVYDEYGYTTPSRRQRYALDFLVPLDLGGSTAVANIWPAALRGVGLFQKNQLNHVLHELVCRRSVPLAQAQHQIATNWYAAWLQYVTATGHA